MKMNFQKIILEMILMLTLLPVGSVFADVLMISPASTTVPFQGHVQFEVQLFNDLAIPGNTMSLIKWRVEPEWLGTITDDGFFMASEKPGEGKVIASIKVMHNDFNAEARIVVGNPAAVTSLLPELIIRPIEAAVGFGDTLQFQAKLRFQDTTLTVPNLLFNWTVQPNILGSINQNGKFHAGYLPLSGNVVAFVEYMGTRIYGKASVVVGNHATSAITGAVRDEDAQVALAGAVVEAQRIGMIPWFRHTMSDENGNYQLGKLIPGWYVIRAMKDGFVTEYYENVRHFSEATPIQLAEQDTMADINFNLNHGGAIAGTIYSEDDSTRLANVHVYAFLAVSSTIKCHTMTDENGEYVLSGLGGGSYIVGADKSGYRGEFYDNVSRLENVTPVVVTDPDTSFVIDFALGVKGAIAGRVVSDDNGSPIKGALVTAKNLNQISWLMVLRTLTDENGDYVLEAPVGHYVVQADADGFNGEYFDNTYDPALATPVQVLTDQHTKSIDFSLAANSRINGTVTDQLTGLPIAGAAVWAFAEVGEHTPVDHLPVKARTDNLGHYQLTDLQPGIYFVKAWAQDYQHEFYNEASSLSDATPVQVGYNAEINEINFTLSPAGSISGRVVAEQDNSPIARALVIVKEVNSNYERNTFTNDVGDYTLTNLPAGSYYVLAMARGFYREYYDNAASKSDATPVVLAESEARTGVDFSLSPLPEDQGAITGLIYSDQDSLPIPGAIVAVLPVSGGVPYFGVTGPDGQYVVKGLGTGKYYVVAWASGFIGEFYDDARNWKHATKVEVVSPNETPNIDFGLAEAMVGPYIVRGNIFNRHLQHPVGFALVYIIDQNEVIIGFGMTDEDGYYNIPQVPAGKYRLLATAADLMQDNDANSSTQDSLAVDLSSGQSDYQANITMDLDVATAVATEGNAIPKVYALEQNFPNPFNPETEIRFLLPEYGEVSLRIFNILGQTVATLVNGTRQAGEYTAVWNGLNQLNQTVPSGIYFYQIQVKNQKGIVFEQIHKMTLMR